MFGPYNMYMYAIYRSNPIDSNILEKHNSKFENSKFKSSNCIASRSLRRFTALWSAKEIRIAITMMTSTTRTAVDQK